MNTPRYKLWMLSVSVAFCCFVAGFLLYEPIAELFREKSAPPPPVKIQLSLDAKKIAAERAKFHMEWADAQSLKAVDEHLAKLSAYFEEVKKRTPEFAMESLGWGSKWRFAVDRMPFTRTDRNEIYLQEKFAAHIFSQEQLTQSIEAVVNGYNSSVQSTEGLMLVRIKADIADLPQASLPRFASKESLERAFASALDDASKKVQVGLRNQIIQHVAAEVLMRVAVRLGVSSGILGVGAGSSWATLGASIPAAIIVDWVVAKIWDWWADPVGDLSKMLDGKLDEIYKLIVDADGTNPGLRGELLELHENRKQLRQQAVGDLIESCRSCALRARLQLRRQAVGDLIEGKVQP